MQEEYLFLETSKSEKEHKSAPCHIVYAEDPATSLRLATETFKKLRVKYPGDKTPKNEALYKISEIVTPEKIEDIIDGNFNLINTLVERSEKGKPVDTIVFLDKSARNGEYLFHQTCQELLHRQEISESAIPKNIRFISIDKVDAEDNTFNRGLITLLREKFRKEDFVDKQVLVVDEYVSTGKTLKIAMEVIEEMYGIKPMGIQMYKDCPTWYGSESGILGVSEISDEMRDENTHNFYALRDLDKDTVLNLNKFVNRLGPKILIPLFKRLGFIKSRGLESDDELRVIQNTLEKLNIFDITPEELKLIQQLPSEIVGTHLWDYFHDVGGFISRRMEGEEMSENFRQYRRALKDIVSESMYQRDLTKD